MSVSEIKQIPMDFSHRVAYGREDFLIAPSNQEAVQWIDMWPKWPAPALIIYGDEASGKTHLSYVWQDRTGAQRIPANDLKDADFGRIFECDKCVIIEDVSGYIGDREFETALFHLYNMAKEEQAHILLTASSVQSGWDFVIPDLRSRLCAAPSVSIHEPDDVLLQSILVKLFSDRQLDVSIEVINYILPRTERSFRFIKRLVERADKIALSEKKAVTIPVIRKAFESLASED